MTQISGHLLHEIGDLVRSITGLHYPQDRMYELDRGIRSVATELGLDSAEDCFRWLTSSANVERRVDTLVNHLAIGETYFFRHPETWEALEQHVLPGLIRERNSGSRILRVWSAGCSTGEEAYSMAILIDRLVPDRSSWHIDVLATDINRRVLHKASEAVYTEWSFRGVPAAVTERYFVRTADGRHKLSSHIKEMVSFDYLNLVDDTLSCAVDVHDIDLIMCRNVFIYFTPEQVGKVMASLYRALAPGGWLVTSPVEAVHGVKSDFASVRLGKATLFRKSPQTLIRVPKPQSLAETTPRPDTPVRSRQSCGAKTSSPKASPPKPVRRRVLVPAQRSQPHERVSTYVSALTLCDQGKYHDAIKLLDELLTLCGAAGSDGQPEALLAKCWANLGDRKAALGWLERALAANRVDPRHHYLRAVILQEDQQLSEAASALRNALFLNHDFVLAHFAFGVVEQERGRPDEARKHLENALRSLGNYDKHDIVPESDGIAAGQLEDIIMCRLQGG